MPAVIKKPKALTDGALIFDKPVDLDDALMRIDMLKLAITVGLEQIEKQTARIDELEAERQAEADNFKATIESISRTAVEAMQLARVYMKAGRISDAEHEIDKAFRDLDPGRRIAGSVVALPLFPQAGSFAA